MKIAIVSSVPRVGKTYFMLSLAHTYSRSQQAKVAIFSTSELSHVTEPLLQVQDKDEAATAGVFKAMLETGTIRGEDLFSYSVRSGRDEVFIFDLFNRKNDLNQNLEFLARTIKSIESKMILVEINGDPKSVENQVVLDTCDVIIDLFTTDNKSIAEFKAYDKSLPDMKINGRPVGEKYKNKVLYLCSMYDPRILSEKKLSGLLGKGQKDIMTFEYNPTLAKLMLDGDYGAFTDKIVYGHEDLLKLRRDLLVVMQKLYDDSKRKRIKEIKDWPKL